jgi:hypothetical protein
VQAADVQIAGGADHLAVRQPADGEADPLAALGLALQRAPPILEAFAAAVGRHDLPALGIAVDRAAQLVAQGGGDRFQPDVAAFEGENLDVHGPQNAVSEPRKVGARRVGRTRHADTT